MPDLWEKLSEVYNMDSVPDEAKSIIGDAMLEWSEGQEGDTISRKSAIDAICEDGTWLERQGCTEITMAERKQRDVDILSALSSFSRDHENDHTAEFSKMVAQPEPCEGDPRADVYYLAEKIGIHRLYALVVELRGEPEPCEDAVSRQAAIDATWEDPSYTDPLNVLSEVRDRIKALPSAQPSFSRDHENDRSAEPCEERLISLQAAIDEIKEIYEWHDNVTKERIVEHLGMLPSAQPNLSEAYSKAVFTWLLDYQVKSAELKGRYTPYEVLSWVINDWRKENE